jgi:hypothetical protein
MPCFKPGQAFDEGIIIGRLLAGYGELELGMCSCLIAVEGMFDRPIRLLFSQRGEKLRMKTAERALKSDYANTGLLDDLMQALESLDWCRQIRNQYSHCHWYWTSQEGLCFVNLEELAQQVTTITDLMANRHSIDVTLLTAQENYFWYVKECFIHLDFAYKAWDQSRGRGEGSGLAPYVYPKPAVQTRPPQYN